MDIHKVDDYTVYECIHVYIQCAGFILNVTVQGDVHMLKAVHFKM